MLGPLGAPELIIIALVVVLLFGVGKISGLGREIGSSIKEFRKAVKDEKEEEQAKPAVAPPQQAPPVQYSQPAPQQQYAPPPPQQQAPQAPPQQYAPPPPPPQQGESKNIF
jgi:TatA/E family protein of Tat protein translocase